MDNFDFEILDFSSLAYVLGELGSNIDTLQSIGQTASGSKVSYNAGMRTFESQVAAATLAEGAASWIPGISYFSNQVANVVEAGSQFLYGIAPVRDAFEQVEGEIVDTLIRAESLIHQISREELQALADKVELLVKAFLGCQDGIENIKHTYRSEDLIKDLTHLKNSIDSQLSKLVPAICTKLKDQVEENDVGNVAPVIENDVIHIVDESLENASVEVTLGALPVVRPTVGETRRLEKYCFNGENLKSILDRLSPQGRYSFATFIHHWIEEKSNGGRSVSKNDPVALRLAPMRIGGASLLDALNVMPHREWAVLRCLILGDYYSRIAG